MIRGDTSKNRIEMRIINGKAQKVKIDSKGAIIGLDKMISKEVKSMGRGLKPITGKIVEVDGKLISVPEADQNKDKDGATEQSTNVNKTDVESTTKDEVKEVKIESTTDIKAKKVKIEQTANNKAKETITKPIKEEKIMVEETADEVYARRDKEKEHDKRQNEIHSFVEKACSGVDCLKNDMSNMSKDIGDTNKRLDYIAKKIEEDKSYLCENCGENNVKAFSSYCPNCSSPIHVWNDDDKKPIKTWKPYWKRINKVVDSASTK